MYRFYSDCVSWPEDAFIENGLSDMIDNSIDITRKTFLKYVHDPEIEKDLGYCCHSAIEYVYTEN